MAVTAAEAALAGPTAVAAAAAQLERAMVAVALASDAVFPEAVATRAAVMAAAVRAAMERRVAAVVCLAAHGCECRPSAERNGRQEQMTYPTALAYTTIAHR